jgi:hypothetical protein
MSTFERSDIRVVVDTGEHYSVHLEMAGNYDISVTQGDNYHVIVETPTTTVENVNLYFRIADLAYNAISASFAQTSSYALNVPENIGFPFEGSAVISGSLLLVDFGGIGGITGSLLGTASTASYVSIDNVDGFSTYSASVDSRLDDLDNELSVTASLLQNNINQKLSTASFAEFSSSYTTGSFTGSFVGDGSQLTGLVTDLRISGSTGSDVVSLLTDDLLITGSNGITAVVTNNVVTIGLPAGVVSSSAQINTGSFSGSFVGDGSQLTGLVTDLRISGSTGSDVVSLLTDDLTFSGTNGITTAITNNTVTINLPLGVVSGAAQVKELLPSGTVSSSTQAVSWTVATASYAINADLLDGLDSTVFATTGSNIFVGNQTITGSLSAPAITGSLFGTASFAEVALNDGRLNKVFYVTEQGNDANDGKTLSTSFRTIKAACVAASASIAANTTFPPSGPAYRVSIEVKSGYYTEEAPITVPSNTSILGDDLRTVVVRPTTATKNQNLFLLNNSTYIWGLRLEGCQIDDLEDPRNGFFFAFAPGALIITSPYIQNCTAVNTPSAAFYAPLNPDVNPPNPLVGAGPGGMIIDDSVLDGYSPLRSMVCDAFTQVAFNGIGVCVRGRGYVQLVSVFTNFSRVGIYAIDGGQASLLNSNTTFGDYGLRAKGKRILVVPDVSGIDAYTNSIDATLLKSNKSNILNYMITQLGIDGNYSASYANTSSSIYAATLRDAGLLIDAFTDDLLSPKTARISQFTQGLFKGQDTSQNQIFTLPPASGFDKGAIAVFPVNDGKLLANDFIYSYELIRDYIINDPDNLFTTLSTETNAKVVQLLQVPIDVIQEVVVDEAGEQFLQVFGSLITSTAHDFSYAGAGVNFLALPPNQGGIGQTNFDLRVVEEDGGRVFHTSGDETGDFFAGNDFVIKQSNGTIEGRTFTKALAARFVPLNLALEG